MANDKLNQNISSELNIEAILSAPLVAASKANVIMVTGQTKFLLDYCFAKEDGSKQYKPVMIEMVMSKGEIDSTKSPTDPDYIKVTEMSFGMPLVCLVPLNSIAIKDVKIDFDMEITSMRSKDTNSNRANTESKKVIPVKAQLNGKISNQRESKDSSSDKTHYKSQSTSRLNVNINAGSLPLPTGVLTLIDMYTKAIQPLPSEKK